MVFDFLRLDAGLVKVIRTLAKWEGVPAETLAAGFIEAGIEQRQEMDREQWYRLTIREQQVAYLIVAGCSNPKIASQLYVSKETVKSYVTRLLQKFAVSDRQELRSALLRSGVDFEIEGRRLMRKLSDERGGSVG